MNCIRDLLTPADEVGEEVGYGEEVEEDKGNLHVKSTEVRLVKGQSVLFLLFSLYYQQPLTTFLYFFFATLTWLQKI